MRTVRGNKYYRDGHGRCAFPGVCRCQNDFEGEPYCTDTNGERNDYCRHFIRPGEITSIAWMIKTGETWEHMKSKFRVERAATFMLPIELTEDYMKYKISDFSEDFMTRTKGVMYTNDQRIEEKYGKKMNNYSYSFLRNIFEEELQRMQA